ncbi:tumor necrosis factor receptor superfamily member 6B isoform X2 [Heterocephalus glaber]|uniref:Tumor necrosis factor receptor superfamily member 6B isoform X2 n=1 Tax=Heterocephalus glaber TaxID=10181 RepID=A0AAX6QRT1_HETGA|nr:tumor necrosis factor receptor superfamily member 6B isoform X2 [Heterocephalus glaber]
MGAANPAASAGRARDSGYTHVPVAGHGDAGVADLCPVSPGHFREAAVPPWPTHDLRCVPAAPLHAVLELPGALPLLQCHLRGARGRGAGVRRHPQPRLPLPPGLLHTRWLLPGAPALSARRRSTPSRNTQCQPCPAGTFSASSSSSEECRPHRNCTALGLALNVPGSSSRDTLCTSCAGFALGSGSPGEPGTEECERAVIDFVVFQDISFKRLQRLQRALGGPGAPSLSPSREGRAALQTQLRRRLSELGEAPRTPLLAQLLAALRAAGLPGLERGVRARFLPAG